MAEPRQDRRIVVPHVGFIVGDGDPEGTAHEGSRGRVRTISAPAPGRPDGDPAAVGLDDPSGDRHAQAGAACLGREERLEDPRGLLGREPRAVVADRDPQGGPTVDQVGFAADPELDRVGAGRQGVLHDITEDLDQAEGVEPARRSRPSRMLLDQLGPAAAAGRLDVEPGLAPDARQVVAAPLQADRRRVVPDVLEEVVQVVLRLLGTADQVERRRPVLDVQGQHLEAGLAPLQGVPALVGQPGDHLADRREPLGLQGPLLGPLQLGDVVADAEQGLAPLVVLQEARVPDDLAEAAVAAADLGPRRRGPARRPRAAGTPRRACRADRPGRSRSQKSRPRSSAASKPVSRSANGLK